MAYGFTEEYIHERKIMRHVQYLEATCTGHVRESKMTRTSKEAIEEYYIFYDLFNNEFWSDITMRAKYKKNAEKRISDRAAHSYVVHHHKKRDRPCTCLADYDLFSTYQMLASYEIKNFIWIVPRILFLESSREALEAGVPIEDIIA